jgi:hypothetical protein
MVYDVFCHFATRMFAYFAKRYERDVAMLVCDVKEFAGQRSASDREGAAN